MISRQTSVGIFCALASSSESASTSVSPRKRKISPARFSPTATSRAAAFWAPRRLLTDFGASVVASSVLIGLVLRHPGLDLGGDALGLALHQLVELVQARVRHPRRGHRGGGLRNAAAGLRLEGGQRHGLLDLGQPARRAEALALAALHAAG